MHGLEWAQGNVWVQIPICEGTILRGWSDQLIGHVQQLSVDILNLNVSQHGQHCRVDADWVY